MEKKFNRVFLIVLDSLGFGAMPDAKNYDDEGSNTFGNIATNYNLNIPNLEKLGIGYLGEYNNIKRVEKPSGFVGLLSEVSNGKDTMTGHWELMGLKTTKPFKVFPQGFPKSLFDIIKKHTGVEFIGNYAASGTKIIQDLGEDSIKTGKPIIYTSADSVLQIAAHEKYFGLDNLYQLCQKIREITLEEQYRIGRVIARPFLGESFESFKRTSNRHDYALSPSSKTYLDHLKDNNLEVISIGKIADIFNGSGITKAIKTISNHDGMNKIIEQTKEDFKGLCFANLVDFDMEYGHRRDVIGYAKSIEEFDGQLQELLEFLKEDDLLILTADHGNDPTFKGTDHTREFVPFILFSKKIKNGGHLKLGKFADVGATIANNFNIDADLEGESRLNEIFLANDK